MSKTDTKPTITEKIHNLDEQVAWFYSEDFQLDQALDKYNEALKLAKSVEKDLSNLKNKVTVIEDFTKS